MPNFRVSISKHSVKYLVIPANEAHLALVGDKLGNLNSDLVLITFLTFLSKLKASKVCYFLNSATRGLKDKKTENQVLPPKDYWTG